MTGPTPVVSIDDLRFVYREGGIVALDGVSLEVARGSVVGVAGQNGSGKTTLTKHLNGLLRPTSGRVLVEGLDTARHPVRTLARHVGYVFQNPNHQLFARTVADELAFGPRNLGCTSDEVEARVAAVSAAFDLDSVLGTHPYRLPFPLRKLVSIASVLTMRPSVVVLDEPTNGQDHRTARRIADLIAGLRDGGTTVMCVSHDMLLVAGVVDRLIVLRDGRVVADGTPRQVLSDRELIASTRLSPPQITELSLAIPGRGDRSGALSIAELLDEFRTAG